MQKGYEWLWKEPGPNMMVVARGLVGIYEQPGSGDNPTILSWAKALGLSRVYSHDSIPWCGLFMAFCAKSAGWEPVENPLWAANWGHFGVASEHGAELGDVLVFTRKGGGHVGLYVGETGSYYHVLGGNQSDAVNIKMIPKSRCSAVRRPIWRVAEPPNRRKILLKTNGNYNVSTSEL